MFLHHGRALLLIERPPVGAFSDRNHDHVGLGARLAGRLQIGFHLVRKPRHVIGLLRQAVHDAGRLQMLAEEAALKIDEKLLRVAHLGGMHAKHEIGVIG